MTQIAFTVAAASKATCVGEDRIREAIKVGDLTPHYVGVKAILRAADLDAWIETLPTEKPA